jgi:hypothetical protein
VAGFALPAWWTVAALSAQPSTISTEQRLPGSTSFLPSGRCWAIAVIDLPDTPIRAGRAGSGGKRTLVRLLKVEE